MLSTCSPQRDTAMMGHVSSPNQTAQYDHHHPILEEIRRTLSRSPSKSAELRQYSFRSSPARGNIPFFPSALSPSRRSTAESLLPYNSLSSPHSTRLNQSSRIQRPNLRRTTHTNGITRSRTSPKSPTKRSLVDLGDTYNSTPMLRKRSSTELENDDIETERTSFEDKENMFRSNDDHGGPKSAQPRQEKRKSGGLFMNDVVPLSPMKRSEATMNIDQPDFASPSSKRRSLHSSTGLDFSIFDSDSLQSSFDEKRSQDDNDWIRTSSPLSQGRFSTIPKRSSSLRKSTLQQRQSDKSVQTKPSHISELNSHWAEMTPGFSSKKPVRMSLDSHLQPLPRESPFSAEGKLISASIHPLVFGQPAGQSSQPHPLSRTLTQSSSHPSSVQDDSPTHEPIHRPDRPRSHDFSKSLPIGAHRPYEPSSQQSTEFSSQDSYATPATYKFARPLPAAFMSTGLISKKNRNVDEPEAGLPKAHMPDTPCKKPPTLKNDAEGTRANITFKPRQSFGTPATPADISFGFARANPLPWAKNASIFGARASKPSLIRKASFASIEGEDKTSFQSPTGGSNSQSTDVEYPPTPTKHTDLEALTPVPTSPSPHHRPASVLARTCPGSSQVNRFSSSKLSPVEASPESMDGDSDGVLEDSPSIGVKPRSLLRLTSQAPLSFSQRRMLANLQSPTALTKKAIALHHVPSPLIIRTKTMSLPVSPHLENIENFSPRTPSENFLPPDPSGLSISGRGDRPLLRPGSSHLQLIPATPTGPRDYFHQIPNRPSLKGPEATDVDETLTQRFGKVDVIGLGEFSFVYRVSNPPKTSPFGRSPIAVPSHSTTQPTHVWAVKKSKFPYSGPKDRQRKVHEVDVLKGLGHNDHIVQFVDSWENNGHLYIQTEYCEEKTLDVFLSTVGHRARLDDFRIWKILLELSLGLKHVHDCGFIHLDLKPANIFITFEGVLKIGDFGMAARWPAKAGIEGEGDREYIGPEVLKGQYDKPADVFALGLITLETAGNVALPDNGTPWQKLRSGDMSDVPSLTWSSEDSNILRDVNGVPLLQDDDEGERLYSGAPVLARSGELLSPPDFMIDAGHEQALDAIVRWMIDPEPLNRPTMDQILQIQGVRFAEERRRAGATIFEGNWGPASDIIGEDSEMIDV